MCTRTTHAGAQLWQFPAAGTYTLVPVTTSPTVTPGGYVFVTVGQQFTHTLTCAPGCVVPVTWTIERIDPHVGSVVGAWGLGGGPGMVGADVSGNPLPGSGFSGPSSAAYDPATGLVFAGEPNVMVDLSNPPIDLSSGVIALHAPDNGGSISFAWEQRWANNAQGVSAAPVVGGGHVVGELGERFAGVRRELGRLAGHGDDCEVATRVAGPGREHGVRRYRERVREGVRRERPRPCVDKRQALDGSSRDPVTYASPVVVGENDSNGVVPYLVFDTSGNGDLKAFNR